VEVGGELGRGQESESLVWSDGAVVGDPFGQGLVHGDDGEFAAVGELEYVAQGSVNPLSVAVNNAGRRNRRSHCSDSSPKRRTRGRNFRVVSEFPQASPNG